MANPYHENVQSAAINEGFSAKNIIDVGKAFEIKKIAEVDEKVIDAIMQELQELNILRKTKNNLYLFSRYSFFQMMGTANEVEDKLLDYMEV